MEIWKDIKNYKGYYQVSNQGKVKSLRNDLILSMGISDTGYGIIALCINNKLSSRMVHRLVAEYFVNNPENKPQVNHKNGIKIDNRAINLEWMTPKENIRHSIQLGLKKYASRKGQPREVLNKYQVSYIKYRLRNGYSVNGLAKTFEVCRATIRRIRDAISWKHVK